MQRNPHAGETREAALVMMLFESARLSDARPDDASAAIRRRHRSELTMRGD